MKLKRKQIWSVTIILIAVFILGTLLYAWHKTIKEDIQIDGLKYQKAVSVTDRAPLPVPPSAHTVKLPILMYHHIGTFPENANGTRKDLTVPVADFEQEVKWLNENGYHSVSLEQLYLYTIGKFTLPNKPIVFTFDDGYQDVFDNAVPILQKYGFVGSFAIITQWPGQTMGDNVYANWQTIADAQGKGMEIVSHTQNHFDGKNPKFNSDYILKNLTGSVDDIKNHLGFTSNILIYPYGHYTAEYIKLAKQAGFVMGITVHEGDTVNLDNLMEIPRIRVHGQETLERFQDILCTKYV